MADARHFDAWCVPAWTDRAGPEGAETGIAEVRPRRATGSEAASPVLRYPELDEGSARELAHRLVAHRDRLADLPASELAHLLGRVGRRFLEPGDPLRDRALQLLPSTAGISPAMARAVLDGMAADWTPERLEGLLRADLGRPEALDAFVPGAAGGRVRAFGPRLGVHLSAGTVPGVSVTSLIRGLLVKSPVLLKPGRGDVVLPVLFLRALAREAPEVAAAAAVVYWPGGATDAEDELLRQADLVVVYGSDATVESVRSRLRPTTRLVAYRHRVSLALVGREALGPEMERAGDGDARPPAPRALARAVALFDQRGCVSPHAVYVEEGGDATPRDFAEALARSLEALDRELPSGVVDPEEASRLQQLRGTTELRVAAGEGRELWHGGQSPWTVVYDPDPAFEASCLNRMVRVKPVGHAEELPDLLEPVARHLQTVAAEGLGERAEAVCGMLARIGVSRITPIEAAPWPPPWWHHDGAGALSALIRWADVEPGVMD